MPIPASTIPAAKNYLVVQVTTLVNDPAVLVAYDTPGPYKPDDIIMVGDIHRDITIAGVVGSGGQGWLEEEYEQDIVVSVFRGGDDAKMVFERAAALADTVVQVVRTDPSLGGLEVVAYPHTAVYESFWDEGHKGRITEVTLKIRCSASI